MDARTTLAIGGAGRLGSALSRTLVGAIGPFGRGFDGSVGDGTVADIVLLAVPDAEITTAAAAVRPGPLVGHCSGATTLDALAPHESFSMHPLMTVTRHGASFAGASAAVAGSTPRSLGVARRLADELGMRAVEILDGDRAAYHAAASVAANFLVTLEDAAETLMVAAGGDRAMLVPLVRAALDNWAANGGAAALTGPIARGDRATVDRQRDAIAERAPELLAMFDALADATRALAARRS